MSIADQGTQSTVPERSPVDPIHIVADPAPLGLGAFAMTTLALSLSNANIWAGGIFAALSLALVYGGFAQLLAGMWEFKVGNTFGATAFSSYGAFWLAVGASLQLNLIPSDQAFGVFFLGWTIFTALMFVATLRTNAATIALFGALLVTFVLLTVAKFGGPTEHLGGYFGLLTAGIAWYVALAGLLDSMPSALTLPVWPVRGAEPAPRH